MTPFGEPIDERADGCGVDSVYDDCERGERSWTRLSVARDAGGAWKGRVDPDPNGKRWRYSDVT
jgi:hypothetical protein